jgi:hypothetical protein
MRTPGMAGTATALAITACVLLASCATREFPNAPPAVAEDCRREVALLTDREILPAQEDPLRGPAADSAPDPIEDAREAQKVSGGANLSAWPEEALMYRCLESRGVELTFEQKQMLDEWEVKSGARGATGTPD